MDDYDDFDGFVPIEDDLMYPYNAWQDYMGITNDIDLGLADE